MIKMNRRSDHCNVELIRKKIHLKKSIFEKIDLNPLLLKLTSYSKYNNDGLCKPQSYNCIKNKADLIFIQIYHQFLVF